MARSRCRFALIVLAFLLGCNQGDKHSQGDDLSKAVDKMEKAKCDARNVIDKSNADEEARNLHLPAPVVPADRDVESVRHFASSLVREDVSSTLRTTTGTRVSGHAQDP